MGDWLPVFEKYQNHTSRVVCIQIRMLHVQYILYIPWAQVFQQMCREKKIPEKRDSIFSKMKTI